MGIPQQVLQPGQRPFSVVVRAHGLHRPELQASLAGSLLRGHASANVFVRLRSEMCFYLLAEPCVTVALGQEVDEAFA